MARPGIRPASEETRARVRILLNVVLAVTAAGAVAALVLEYGGFDIEPWQRRALHVIQTVVVAIFVLDRLARMLLAPRPGRYVRENWVDFAVMGAALAAVLIGVQFREHIASAGALYVVITQVYILVSLVVRAVNVNLSLAESGIRPPLLLIASFAVMCLAGSGLLMLPAAVTDYNVWWYPDALFTAVSATCVTGLTVKDTGAHFTPFGQAVILTLIQLGGLGIMLFGTAFAMLVGKGLSVRGSTAMGEMLATEKVGQLRRVALFVVLVALAFEAVGAAMLYPMFSAPQGDGALPSTAKAVWDSVFHSISSFCNAGFCLYSDNMMQGVRDGWDQPLRAHWQIFGVIAPLIVLGGLGFPVLQDCASFLKNGLVRLRHRLRGTVQAGMHNAPRLSLSLHTKVVLTTSVVLLAGGALVLLLVEPPALQQEGNVIGRHEIQNEATRTRSDWGTMTGGQRLGGAIFQSVTARTAGFNTVDMRELSGAGKLVMCSLMVVGGSPASTAGGMKTVTLAVLALAIWSVLLRRPEAEAFRRTIAGQIVRKALALAALYLLLVFVVTLLLCVAMREENFLDVLFEACSACGTVGLSTGITPDYRNPMGEYVVTAAMFIGRLGPLTMLMALTSGLRPVKYAYPTEQVVIG